MRLLGLLIAITLLLLVVGSDAFFQRFIQSRHRKNTGTPAGMEFESNVQPFIRFRKSFIYPSPNLRAFDGYGSRENDQLEDLLFQARAAAAAASQK